MNYFVYDYQSASITDIGKCRSTNQDEVIEMPEQGFFAVSDGMGGLIKGGETSTLIKEWLPQMIIDSEADLQEALSPQQAGKILIEKYNALNDQIFEIGCEYGDGSFGATLSGVWLVADSAVSV